MTPHTQHQLRAAVREMLAERESDGFETPPEPDDADLDAQVWADTGGDTYIGADDEESDDDDLDFGDGGEDDA